MLSFFSILYVVGSCLYNLTAHEDCLVSIASAPSYIITLGLDEKIRVWERFQGHLLNTINLHQSHSYSIVMLTPSLLITAKPGNNLGLLIFIYFPHLLILFFLSLPIAIRK